MTRLEELNRSLEYLKADLEIIKKDEYHPKCHDLLNMIILEEVPALIEFIQKVNKNFTGNIKESTGPYMLGQIDCYKMLKRNIYGE
jgi:hypothetical protein